MTQRLHSDEAAIFFNSKLAHVAREFITTNMGPLFISVHIRTEKNLTDGRHIKNIATVKKCISSLTARVQSHNNASTVPVPIFSCQRAGGGGGGGGYLTKFCTGRLQPEVQPLTLSYTILAEKVPPL